MGGVKFGIRAMSISKSSSARTMFNYSQSQVPIFEGENYGYWADQMRFFFIARDLWEIVEEGYDDSLAASDDSSSTSKSTETSSQVSTQNKEMIKNNALALSYLHQGISKTIYPRILALVKLKMHGKL